jgi:sugar phosphate isomerase/epimerase
VCEGIPDALVAAQAGLRAVGVLGTWAADRTAADELAAASILRGFELATCFDSDKSGRLGADRLRRQLTEQGVAITTVAPPRDLDLTTWAAAVDDWRTVLVDLAVESAPSVTIPTTGHSAEHLRAPDLCVPAPRWPARGRTNSVSHQ